jgi:Alpha/beta hydrolase domain
MSGFEGVAAMVRNAVNSGDSEASMKVPRRGPMAAWAVAAVVVFGFVAFPLGPVARADDAVVLPDVTGPIPVTGDSRPFRDRIGPPLIAMDRAGYVEEEFFVGGRANVYDWGADNQPVVRTPDAPYSTRIVVRRPAKPNKFSGTVWVEPLNPTLGFDLDRMWQVQYQQMLRDGDAYVGITIKPNAILALQTFDPGRYGSLSMANPLPPEEQTCGLLPGQPGYNPNTSRLYENGLAWDIISQVGAVLKSTGPANPLGTPATQVFGTGWSQTGGYAIRYFSTFGSTARLSDGDRVYDGWLTGGATGPTAINQCRAVPSAADARNQIRPSGIPVISVRTQGDFFSFANRRADGDDPDDMYRLYELAGPSHDTLTIFENFAPDEDIIQAGGVPPDPDVCGYEYITDFPYEYYFNAATVNLKQWAEGVAPPYGPRYEYSGNQIVLDQYGNAVGGVRSPYLDVPIATYNAGTSGPFTCLVLGYKAPFSDDQLADLYSNHGDYVRDVVKVTNELVRDRFLLRVDSNDIVSEAAHASVP